MQNELSKVLIYVDRQHKMNDSFDKRLRNADLNEQINERIKKHVAIESQLDADWYAKQSIRGEGRISNFKSGCRILK